MLTYAYDASGRPCFRSHYLRDMADKATIRYGVTWSARWHASEAVSTEYDAWSTAPPSSADPMWFATRPPWGGDAPCVPSATNPIWKSSLVRSSTRLWR